MVTLAQLPELRAQIHPALNDATIDFDSISAKSKQKVWWLGKCNHVWEASIGNRYGGTGCPFCAGQKVLEGFNDFKTFFPELANEWHPVLNGSLKPQEFTKGSNKKVWWLGSCKHEWEQAISNRANGAGCLVCAGKVVLPGFNDLASNHPEVAKLWHPRKNDNLLPSQVTPSSNKTVWWLGKCGHEWDTKVNELTRPAGRGCPICSGKRILPGFNDLASSNVRLAAEWDYQKNGTLLPNAVAAKSGLKVWWLGLCGHGWQATVLSRHQGNGCPYCANQKVIKGDNDFETHYPEIASQWNHVKNGDLTPDSIPPKTSKVVWWICQKGHEWESSVANRVRNGRGCPYCVNQKVEPGYNDLATTHPHLVQEWHVSKNGNLTPEMFVAGSTRSVWWTGKECSHEWEMPVFNKAAGVGCPYCGNQKILVGFNDVGTTHPHLVSEWHDTLNILKTMEEVTYGSSHKAWWRCVNGHEWQSRVNDRGSKGQGCPECAAKMFCSKAEHEIAEFLRSHGLNVKQTERKALPGMEIDIYLPENNIGIEYNGLYWHSEDMGKDSKYHHAKWLIAKKVGIQLVQIWEDEWIKNPEQVKAMLLHKVGKGNQRKVYARNTDIEEVSKSETESFLEENHIQGYASGSHYLGLREKKTGVLTAVLVLKKEAGKEPNVLNIIRYATNAQVVGGFTKLMKYAERNLVVDKFITFSDHCVSDGALYANNGFTADKELSPDYMYVVKGKRKHKFGYRLKKFREDPSLKWEEGLTERELALLNNIPRIWDAGKTRWIKNLTSDR